jgi:Ca-activated chloride channel family protein
MNRTALLLALFLLTLTFRTSAQDRSITGRVTDAANGQPIPGATVLVKGTTTGTTTDQQGKYSLRLAPDKNMLVFQFIGYITQEVAIRNKSVVDVKMRPDTHQLEEVVVSGVAAAQKRGPRSRVAVVAMPQSQMQHTPGFVAPGPLYELGGPRPDFNTESYDRIRENGYLDPTRNPLSTFSIDVDAASYSNVRRFLTSGQTPPKDAVRIEEMVNYFHYDYPQPQSRAPLSITSEVSGCPWNPENRLLLIGLQGKAIATDHLPAANLVFLIDVSGSMESADKLPLVKAGFKLLVNQLRPQDQVAIVVYAGAAGLVLPATPGHQKDRILAAIDNLQAGGSTAGGQGLELAYLTAQQNFKKEGNNRVILATDGDFNVGVSSDAEMERLIEKKRQGGVFLTVLGFGRGNLKDSKMEKMADQGNGHYAYIDNILEARKVFVNEFGGTLFTIAKDVKLQLEFNPAYVKAYRLIGYENRALRNEDFNNDKKDAGDLGAGHTVTALYEIVPASTTGKTRPAPVDELKYQTSQVNPRAAATREMLTLKLRYKDPADSTSQLLQQVVTDKFMELNATSDNFRFAAAVAAFGLLLRDSEFKGQASYAGVLALAENARGKDLEGYRVEFINLVKSSQLLSPSVGRPTGKR